MGSRSSPNRLTVSPQPPPPDRPSRHQNLAIAPQEPARMRSRASVPPSRHLGLSDFRSRALVGAELARDAPAPARWRMLGFVDAVPSEVLARGDGSRCERTGDG